MLAKQINYDFNDQGYNFKEGNPFTLKDIYRQPDCIAGYSYLMLFAYDFFGDQKFLAESRTSLTPLRGLFEEPMVRSPKWGHGQSRCSQAIDARSVGQCP